MTASHAFVAQIEEALAELGDVSVRRMFGGAGVYLGAAMFGLIARDVLYFKTDADGRARFEAEGCGPFMFQTRKGPATVTSYWRVPDRLMDEPEELIDWAREALAVAGRAAGKRNGKPGKGRPTVSTRRGK